MTLLVADTTMTILTDLTRDIASTWHEWDRNACFLQQQYKLYIAYGTNWQTTGQGRVISTQVSTITLGKWTLSYPLSALHRKQNEPDMTDENSDAYGKEEICLKF